MKKIRSQYVRSATRTYVAVDVVVHEFADGTATTTLTILNQFGLAQRTLGPVAGKYTLSEALMWLAADERLKGEPK